MLPKNTPLLYTGEFEEKIDEIKELGYCALELHIRRPIEYNAYNILKLCEKKCMFISAIASGLSYLQDDLSLIHFDEEVRNQAKRRIVEYIDLAKLLGAKLVLGTIRGTIPNLNKVEEYLLLLKHNLEPIIEYAEKNKVEIVLEAINRYETNYLNSVKETTEFVKSFNSKYLKVHIDTFHMNIEDSNFVESIIFFSNHIGYVHFADSNRLAPGKGHIDFKSIINALKNVEYKGIISFECFPKPNSYQAAKTALEYIYDIQ